MSNGTLKALKPGLEKQKEQDQDSVFLPLPALCFFLQISDGFIFLCNPGGTALEKQRKTDDITGFGVLLATDVSAGGFLCGSGVLSAFMQSMRTSRRAVTV